MKPTMKLRWRRAEIGDSCAAFGEQWRSGFSDEWGELKGRVLQQWWEEDYRVTLINKNLYDVTAEIPDKPKGEWRDVPIDYCHE